MEPTSRTSEVRLALHSGFPGFARRSQAARGGGGLLRRQGQYPNNVSGISVFMENARREMPATLFFFFFLMISPQYERSLTLRFCRTLRPPRSPAAPHSHFLSPSLDSKHRGPGTRDLIWFLQLLCPPHRAQCQALGKHRGMNERVYPFRYQQMDRPIGCVCYIPPLESV